MNQSITARNKIKSIENKNTCLRTVAPSCKSTKVSAGPKGFYAMTQSSEYERMDHGSQKYNDQDMF